jgi:hypothetical protein
LCYEEVKEDALQKRLPVLDEATTRERVFRMNVEIPDLATLKDFFHFVAASSKGMIVEQSTAKLLNTFGKWFFAGVSRVTGTPTDADDRSEVFNVIILYHPRYKPGLNPHHLNFR